MRALVTGAGRRLGRAMAIHLARLGHDVAVHYAHAEVEAAEVVSLIEGMGRRAAPLRADLLEDGAPEALLPRAAEALRGPVTCLVNSASVFDRDTLADATRETWDRHMGSNLRAPFALIQAMAAQGLEAAPDDDGEPVAAGCIVNMIDSHALGPMPGFATYALAKEALWSLTRQAARDLAPHIRVNAVAPGPTMRAARQSESHFARQRAATPLGRGPGPGDICAALAYLVGARAVTGEMIRVDGGHHLG